DRRSLQQIDRVKVVDVIARRHGYDETCKLAAIARFDDDLPVVFTVAAFVKRRGGLLDLDSASYCSKRRSKLLYVSFGCLAAASADGDFEEITKGWKQVPFSFCELVFVQSVPVVLDSSIDEWIIWLKGLNNDVASSMSTTNSANCLVEELVAT